LYQIIKFNNNFKNNITMKKFILTVAVLFTTASISLACGEEGKKACCKKGGEKTCAKKDEKACANKEAKTCAKAKSCCKSKAAAQAAEVAPALIEAAPAK
jgi:hypothetical protein